MVFARNLEQTITYLVACIPEERENIINVLYVWNRDKTFPTEIVTPIMQLLQNESGE